MDFFQVKQREMVPMNDAGEHCADSGEVFEALGLGERDATARKVPGKSRKVDDVCEGHAGLDRVPRDVEGVDGREDGGTMEAVDGRPVEVGAKADGITNGRTIVLVFKDPGMCLEFRLPDVDGGFANLACVAAGVGSVEWVAVIEVVFALELYDEERFVRR